jgi:CHAD domain-containing protein
MTSKKTQKAPRLYLRRGEKISKGLRVIAALQLEAAIDELHGNNVSPGPVHNARTYIKKVRSIVQLAAPALGRVRREHLLELLHEASSRLGPLRDSEVQVRSLDVALEAAGLPAEQFSSLRSGLADIAKQRRSNDWRQVPRIRGFLEKALKTVPEWPLDPLGGKDIRRRIRRTYRRGRTTLDLCLESPDPQLFHNWRRLVKQLGYQMRITQRFWPDSADELISSINKIGELAGQEHDYSLLVQTMKHGPKNRTSEEAIALVEESMPNLHKKAIEEGKHLYEAKPKLFVENLDL